MMKRFFYILFACLAVSCVGQLDDDDPHGGGGGTAVEAGAGIVLDFTATWCVNCPRMHEAINEAMLERPGKIIPISIHFQDDMACEDGLALISHFGVEAYPSLVANMSRETLITATSWNLILAKLDAAADSLQPCILEAAYAPGDHELSVLITPRDYGTYSISAALLEDGIVAAQTGGSENYVHDNVFRGFLQENLLGDPLGTLAAGHQILTKFPVPEQASGSRHIVAFVCHDGIVNSAIDLRLQ